MKAIFQCSNCDVSVLEEHYKGVIEKEFYEGEIGAVGDGPISLTLEKGLDHPLSIVHLSTPNRITYRRSQAHIRHNQVEVYVIWRIGRGGLELSRSSGWVRAEEGQIIVFDSSTPFFAELVCDAEGQHDSLQAVVPAYLFREYLGDFLECRSVLDVRESQAEVVDQLLETLSKHGDHMSPTLAESLCRSLLMSLGESLTSVPVAATRKSISDRRLEEIEHFIGRNLTNRKLSTNSIAEACKISPRYLCYILKSAGHTFSQLVWDKRLELAKSWLVAPSMQGYLVYEIAGMAGYTSAAHFSRTFKLVCGCTPTEYRQRFAANPPANDLAPATLPPPAAVGYD